MRGPGDAGAGGPGKREREASALADLGCVALAFERSGRAIRGRSRLGRRATVPVLPFLPFAAVTVITS
jgi:hypothetical protein